MCAKRRSASCKKRRIFWRETHTPLWLLIGRIIFLTIWILLKQLFLSPSWPLNQYYILTHFSTWKNIVRDSDWTYHFFTCENHRSLLSLARTNLRMKIYDIAVWWVFLIMYIINSNMPKPWKWYHFRAEILRVGHCREYLSRLTRFTE